MRNKLKFGLEGIGMVIASIGIMLAMCVVFGAVVMLLWNSLMPQIFGLMPLNYLQAVGLLVLARVIFGGMDGGLHNQRQREDGNHSRNRNELREKWMNMSEDERKEFMNSRWVFSRCDGSFDERSDERTNGRPNGGGRDAPDSERVQNAEGKRE